MTGSDNINSIDLTQATFVLTERIVILVGQTRSKASVYLNSETTLMNWQIGQYIHLELKQKGEIKYGKQILATLSQQLSWSHLIELITPLAQASRLCQQTKTIKLIELKPSTN